EAERAWLGCAVGAIRFRVHTKHLDHHPPQHPVTARHRGWLRGHRHQRVHEIRILPAPDPSLHAAAGIAEREAQVADAEALGQEPGLSLDNTFQALTPDFFTQALA